MQTPKQIRGQPPRARPRLTPGRVRAALKTADLGLIAVAGLVAARRHSLELDATALFWFVVACALLVALDLFASAGVYRPRGLGRIAYQIWRVTGAWTATLLLLGAFALVSGSLAVLPASFFVAWWLGALATLLVLHVAAALAVGFGQRAGWLSTRLVLVGAGTQAADFIARVREHDPGVVIAGIFDERRSRVPAFVEDVPVLGNLDALAEWMRTERVDQIVITLPYQAAARRLICYEKLRHLPVDVRLSPDVPGLEVVGNGTADIAGVPLLRVFDRPLTGWSRFAKGIEDRVIAAVVLVLTAPVLVGVAVLVRSSSRGPVLVRQRRYGFDHRPIDVLRFRTNFIAPDSENGAEGQEAEGRLTRVGLVLRRTGLDELPQFFNVLWGQMSVVGPRPHAVAHDPLLASVIDDYLSRHRVKPGITGWAQIHGLRDEAESTARMQERVRYDLHYIENWSLFLDLRIIFRTLLAGFSHRSA